MFRVVASIVAVPILLVLLLAGALEMKELKLGSLTAETFELGMLPLVVLTAFVMILIFLPLLLLTSRFTKVSLWHAAGVGFLSALLPVLVGTWSTLTDPKLRLNFRAEQLISSYPWLAIGVIGGLLFWLLAIFRNRTLERRASGRL